MTPTLICLNAEVVEVCAFAPKSLLLLICNVECGGFVKDICNTLLVPTPNENDSP